MKHLNVVDKLFLLAERRHQPLHVGALCLFRRPAGAPADFCGTLANHLRESTRATVPFNQRLNGGWLLNAWADDGSRFDLQQHFVHLSLPEPGRFQDLLAMVSRVHSAHLDRAYPLWRIYLIEGLEDDRIALYSKIHHSVVDGVAGIRLMLKSMSGDPFESLDMPAPWEQRSTRRTGSLLAGIAPETSVAARWRARLLKSEENVAAIASVVHQLRNTRRKMNAGYPGVVGSRQAPRSVLNQRITGSRHFVARSISSERIRQLARNLEATTNDVVLALCGGALRRFLLDLNALPDQPLIAAVPVSIRKDGSVAGNQITLALANLGTDRADPSKQLQAVKASMDYAKSVLRVMSPAQILAYTVAMLAPGALSLLPGSTGPQTLANLVISHVPGPRQPVYWQGCALDGIYPASLVLDGLALNITLISRHDQIDFGVIACRKTLPGVHRILDDLERALEALENACGVSTAA